MLRRWLLPLLILLLLPVPAAAQKMIALSFDDVPRARGAFFTPQERTKRIIDALHRVDAPQAVFFVVPGQIGHDDGVGGEARINAYVAAGHAIANHSNSHRHLGEMSAEDYLADIDAAEAWLRPHAAYRPWFRFPFLDEGGKDKAKRDAVRAGLAAGPWLIKPNTEELAEVLDCEVLSLAAQAEAASRLHAQGIEHVVISHGADGVNWFSVGSALHATPPRVSVASTVGAGDSLLAGMLHGLLSADTPEQTLRTATAIAAQAVTQIGFGIHDTAQLAQLEQAVRVRPLTEQ